MAGLLGGVGGLVPNPTTPNPVAAASLMAGGIPMGKASLRLLTAFPTTGFVGINLTAAGSPIGAMAKAGAYALGAFLAMSARSIYSDWAAQALAYILVIAPPWYIFDILQIFFDDSFDENGFQAPFPLKELGLGVGKGGNWNLTMPTLSLIAATLTTAGYAVTKYIPGFPTEGAGKYAQYATLGGGLLLAGVGIFGSIASTPKPAATTTVAADDDDTVQGGGGKSGGLPPLSSFAKRLVQEGGAKAKRDSFYESVTFLGVLGILEV